ncbi:uncharacterized protein [Narcine bancroftii]|uniref:uncharacterized protein isoform X3 n=1 Tax=Narcine bancroftii TaxID=1343680 RepID=UPI00383167FA
MSSQWVCLCGILLSISVQGYNYSYQGWTMSGADVVSAVEGASAVLPFHFTHPPTEKTLTGTIKWYKIKSGVKSVPQLVFNCTYPGLGSSRCDWATQEVGGRRFTFVGNLSRRDASVMMDRLSREDEAWYWCRVDLNINSFQTVVATNLTVRVSLNPTFIYAPVLLVLLITLGIILLIFRKKVNLCPMICSSGPKSNAPDSTSPGGRGEKKQQSGSGDNNRTYEALMTNRETDTCTYASLEISGGEAQAPEAHSADPGGLKIGVRASEEGVIYAAVEMNQ